MWGTPPRRLPSGRCSPVHPHACGEHINPSLSSGTEGGSSPRMWGTRSGSGRYAAQPRFIPTHVGNTGRSHCSCALLSGSSPRMWGTLSVDFLLIALCPVHPHACGEHFPRARFWNSTLGSSPRMWGTQQPRSSAHKLRRFIPTHVGNTACLLPEEGRLPVHPHACGEHSPLRNGYPPPNGSSPRMWGTQLGCLTLTDTCRFIPTHVGNTRSACLRLTLGPVHPHACGEHMSPTTL